jgi:hypothetical protein
MPTTGVRRDVLAMQPARHARGTRSKGPLILAGILAGIFVGGPLGADSAAPLGRASVRDGTATRRTEKGHPHQT